MEWKRLAVHKSVGGLGFKDLRDFNLSMLGKQGWRLMRNQSSLASRVFKARYFPKCDFLNAPLRNNPSFVWRSIWEAKDLLKVGARWSVGTGRTIDVLNQPWLVDDNNPYVKSRLPVLAEATVDAIMQDDRRQWDEDIVTDLFNDRDRVCILQVPLFEGNNED